MKNSWNFVNEKCFLYTFYIFSILNNDIMHLPITFGRKYIAVKETVTSYIKEKKQKKQKKQKKKTNKKKKHPLTNNLFLWQEQITVRVRKFDQILGRLNNVSLAAISHLPNSSSNNW